ncbi:FlgO family outer membrane protein [Alteromonas oceanisediminis]|uniref:FlgO family outer membrane protein n=1 Tax=Alteromonas oceanisediminis TaxID=2836180 RepID=UPI001BDAD27A|nr:FlgO family outer membrane protein [Alteromonas oceanisediminis]MBT0587284.1 hypothetical protein [Alteromonas oceanisediminis]
MCTCYIGCLGQFKLKRSAVTLGFRLPSAHSVANGTLPAKSMHVTAFTCKGAESMVCSKYQRIFNLKTAVSPVLIAAGACVMAGCASSVDPSYVEQSTPEKPVAHSASHQSSPRSDNGRSPSASGLHYQSETFDSALRQPSSDNRLHHYVKDMVSQMMANTKGMEADSTVIITHFTEADSDYNATNKLGFALAESFLVELHQAGLNTIDYKVSNSVRVTPSGDFALSNDFLELNSEIQANYVLVGTMVDQHHGVVVNARIVDLTNNVILAASSRLIPREALNMLAATVRQLGSKGAAV